MYRGKSTTRKRTVLRSPAVYKSSILLTVIGRLGKHMLFMVGFVGKTFRLSIQAGFKALKKLRHKKRTPKKRSQFHPIELLDVYLLKLRLKLFSLPKLNLTLLFLCSVLFFVYSFSLLLHFVLDGMPTPTDLINRQIHVSTKIYDRNGILLYQIYKDQNRTPVALSDIPLHAQLATLAIEDSEFYKHPGFSLRGITRSIINNIKKRELTGGSTITQQLVKNALLTPEKTYLRKLREIILAMQVEAKFSKEEILEMYLNEVSYGNSAYGIEEAAKVYFGKQAKDLTLSESALLAGLPKSPTKFSPFGQNPEFAKTRQHEVLNLMVHNNYINEQQAEEALNTELKFAPPGVEIKAPHFVMYVRELLVDQFGEEAVAQGGLEVYTTLDYSVQQMAEEVVKNEIERLSRLNVTNGAAIIAHPQTGEIFAMVGSKDYFDSANDGNVNVTLRPRSPGSSIKVVTYAYALAHGMTPATIIADTPMTINIPGQPPYTPKNYDSKFRGNITLRSALAESRNIPAVRTITTYGVQNIIDLGKKMGITTWDQTNRFGPSLTLGGGEVKLLDLSQVYATVANEGKKPQMISILKIKNHKGTTLHESRCSVSFTSECVTEQVLDQRVAFLLTDILKDNTARSPAFGTNSALVVSGHPEVAVKTGTSNDLRDNLTVGFNQKYLVAVWVGNNDNSPMTRIASGVTGAAPIWNQIMRSLLKDEESKNWPAPQKIVQLSVCPLTGTLACSGCPNKLEWFLEENQLNRRCFQFNPNGTPAPTQSPTTISRPRGRGGGIFNQR